MKLPSSTDTEVDDKSSYSDSDEHEADEQNEKKKDPGESPDSPDPSSAPTEVPVLTILDLPTIVPNMDAANWYSLDGLGTFFDAGNGWVYQPEMGWCFTEVCQQDLSLWVYSKELGWMWIKSDLPNMCFMEGERRQRLELLPQVIGYRSRSPLRLRKRVMDQAEVRRERKGSN